MTILFSSNKTTNKTLLVKYPLLRKVTIHTGQTDHRSGAKPNNITTMINLSHNNDNYLLSRICDTENNGMKYDYFIDLVPIKSLETACHFVKYETDMITGSTHHKDWVFICEGFFFFIFFYRSNRKPILITCFFCEATTSFNFSICGDAQHEN